MADSMPKVHSVLPFEAVEGWTAIPNTIMNIYTLHPKFNANTVLVYMFLLKNFNREYGYAYPTYDEIEITLNISRGTVANALQVLQELNLITAQKHPYYGNNVYVINPLIETVDEFIKKYPETELIKRRNEEVRQRLNTRKEAFKST